MSHKIDAIDFNNSGTRVNIDKKDADYCPICHSNVKPTQIGAFLLVKVLHQDTFKWFTGALIQVAE